MMETRRRRLDRQPASAAGDSRQGPGRESGQQAASAETVARRAYELYEQRGGEHGRDWDDWFQAEQEARARADEGEIPSTGRSGTSEIKNG